MPLPSQNARNVGTTRVSTFRGRRRGPRPLLAGGLLLVAMVGGLWGIVSLTGGGDEDGTAGTPPVAEVKKTGGAGSPDPGKAETPPKPGPTRTPAQQPQAPRTAPEKKAVTTPPPPGPNGARPDAGTASPTPPASPAPNPASQPATQSQPPAGSSLPADLAGRLAEARAKLSAGDLVGGRAAFNRALADPRTPETEKAGIRDAMTKINAELVFSPRLLKDDPYVKSHTVAGGDALSKLPRAQGLSTDWRLIQRVNRLANPNAIRQGQTLKLLPGPFHAVVVKSAYRLDLYLGPKDRPAEWMYVRSARVGLGEDDKTPVGDFVVRKGSKMINPSWANPFTGERFAADDPKNPLGEYWIGIEGTGDAAAYNGFGLHGTIEPESIGKQQSMGCVRMLADDIALVYECLGEGVSAVRIVP